MTKKQYLELGYEQLSEGKYNTLYRKLDYNDGVIIVQFNEVSEDECGIVHLTEQQFEEIKNL